MSGRWNGVGLFLGARPSASPKRCCTRQQASTFQLRSRQGMMVISASGSHSGHRASGNAIASHCRPRHGSPVGFDYSRLHKLLCPTNLPEPQLFNMGQALFLWNCERWSGHASASNFSGLCDSDGLRHHPSEYRVFARVSGNVGATNGLHARRLAALRCASPRCRQDRCLLTAKYFATQRTVPRGF
jgi:hypothetical protein